VKELCFVEVSPMFAHGAGNLAFERDILFQVASSHFLSFSLLSGRDRHRCSGSVEVNK
jgi:hypothetical protein